MTSKNDYKFKKNLKQSGKILRKKNQKRQNNFVLVSVVLVLVFVSLFILYLLKDSNATVGEAFRGKFFSAQRTKLPLADTNIMKGKAWTDPVQYKTRSNTWTEAIQKALDNSKNVRLAKGQIYEVVKSGSKKISGVPYHYSLSIPSGVTLDLNGATIRLADGQNSIILINENPTASTDSNIKIFGGTFDGNEQGQTIKTAEEGGGGEFSVIQMMAVKNLEIKDVTVKNALEYFGRFLQIDNSKFDNLKGINSRGDGWGFGLTFFHGSTGVVSNSQLGNIAATGVKATFSALKGGKFDIQGNPLIGTLVNSKINSITALQSKAGIKIQDASKNVEIGSVYFEASEDHAPNCGFKIQGSTGYTYSPENINVDKVVVKNCGPHGTYPSGAGLYINGVKDVTINSYEGTNNGGYYFVDGTKNSWPEVWIDYAQDLKIGSITSENCHTACISIRNDAKDYWIGKVKLTHETDPEVQGLFILGGPGRIDVVEEIDNRIEAKDRRLIIVNAPYTKGSIGYVKTNFKTVPDSGPAGTKLWINKDNKDFKIESFKEGN